MGKCFLSESSPCEAQPINHRIVASKDAVFQTARARGIGRKGFLREDAPIAANRVPSRIRLSA